MSAPHPTKDPGKDLRAESTPNDQILARINRLLTRGRLPHALLFVGGNSTEIACTADHITRAILCSARKESNSLCSLSEPQRDAACKSCKLLSAATPSHPDALSFDTENSDGDTMEQLREILTTGQRRPFMGGNRVTQLRNAHSLSLAAHNLLLKTLEEPRPNNFYLLTTPNVSLLPITIRSRTQVWFFPEHITAMPLMESSAHAELAQQITAIGRGELHCGVALAQRIGKEFKDELPQVVASCLFIAHQAVTKASSIGESIRWSSFVGDLVAMEHAVLTRNFNPQYQFAWAFERLATGR